MKYKILIGLVAVIAIVSGFVWGTKDPAPPAVADGGTLGQPTMPTMAELQNMAEDENLGAASSPEVFTYLRVYGALTQGGGITATSTSGTAVPLLASDFDTENVIDVTLNVQDATLTFPATTTLTGFIPYAGMTRTLFVRNATTTATIELTVTGGTGVLLKNATTTGKIWGDTDGGNHARIDLLRKANTDIEAFVTFFGD